MVTKTEKLMLKVQSVIIMGLMEVQRDVEIARRLVEVQKEIADFLNPTKQEKAYEASL